MPGHRVPIIPIIVLSSYPFIVAPGGFKQVSKCVLIGAITFMLIFDVVADNSR